MTEIMTGKTMRMMRVSKRFSLKMLSGRLGPGFSANSIRGWEHERYVNPPTHYMELLRRLKAYKGPIAPQLRGHRNKLIREMSK